MNPALLIAVLSGVLIGGEPKSAVGPNGKSQVPITAPDFKPSQDVYIYVDAMNGSDLNPGTQASPLQTLSVAMATLPLAWTGQCRIILATGTYTVTSLAIRPGVPLGGSSAPFVLQGSMIDSGLGTRTISSVISAVANNDPTSYVVSIVDNTLTPTVDQYVGSFLRITSGAAAGMRRLIRANTVVGQFDLNVGDVGTHPAQGDTFVIESPGSIISYSGNLTFDAVAERSRVGIVLSQLSFTQTGTGQMDIATHVKANTVQMSMLANHYVAMRYGSGLSGDGWDSSLSIGVSDIINLNNYGSGVFITHPSGLYLVIANGGFGVGSSLQGKFVTRNGAILIGAGSDASFSNLDCKGGDSYCLAVDAGGTWEHLGEEGRTGRLTNTGSVPIIKMNASVARMVTGLDISNCGYTAITLQENSAMYAYGGITGSGCAGYGIAVEAGSTVLVSISRGTNTLTGNLGDLAAAGDTIVTGTWAGVMGGTPVVQPVGGRITKNYGP